MALTPEQFEIIKTLNGDWPVEKQIWWLKVHRINIEEFGWGTPTPLQNEYNIQPTTVVEDELEGGLHRR